VKHHASPRFWRSYQGLPKEVRDPADRNYTLLKSDPTHGSLHFKKAGSLWSVRVGLHYRALATEVGNDLVWFWIGSHAEYDRLVGRKPANKAPQPASRARKRGSKTKRRSRASRG
jgi:hypothetical protein